ncbi:MAG: cytidine deaminase [Myxococcota bacterium]|nr:cytidine deaminase [Myxococcota bacterium]
MKTVPSEDALIEAAWGARDNAYAPYSQFQVGAAVLTGSGRIYPGGNVENVAYPVGLCAERSAVAAAISAGEREIVAVAVVAGTPKPLTPCGMCRQTLFEFGLEIQIVSEDLSGTRERHSLADLLPQEFGREDLSQATGEAYEEG